MGKMKFTPLQKSIFELVVHDIIPRHPFYFTGGTALSIFYFGHRESEDLDFFSESLFKPDFIENSLHDFAKQNDLALQRTGQERVYFFDFYKGKEKKLKVDFAYYPHQRLEPGKMEAGIEIDSLRDIGTNKLHTITSRTEVKDFVDLYFLLQKLTFWDLFYGLETKFGIEYDILMFAQDFTKVEQFAFLPKMRRPLTLNELKLFFLSEAKRVASRVVL